MADFMIKALRDLDHHLDHRVGWVERSETQHFVFVGFRSSTQPTFHALDETMIKAKKSYITTSASLGGYRAGPQVRYIQKMQNLI